MKPIKEKSFISGIRNLFERHPELIDIKTVVNFRINTQELLLDIEAFAIVETEGEGPLLILKAGLVSTVILATETTH